MPLTKSGFAVVVAVALALLSVAAIVRIAAAQVIMRPGSGANRSGITVIEPTWEPPYRLTISVYITAQDGRQLPPPLGANVLVIDPQGRRVGMDEAGRLFAEVPNATWAPAVNPQPNAPIGPRGLRGSGVTLDDPGDGHYVLEISGTHHVNIDLAVAQWDRAGRRRWLHFARWWTEPGAVDRWDISYTAAARPAFDVVEQRDDSYFSVRAYGQRGASFESPVTDLLLRDPHGRRVGREAGGQREYHDLPRAGYRSGTDEQEGREIEVMRPPAGIYTLDVTGTAIGSYLLAWLPYDATGQSDVQFEVGEVPTRPGETHRYQLEYAGAPKGRWRHSAVPSAKAHDCSAMRRRSSPMSRSVPARYRPRSSCSTRRQSRLAAFAPPSAVTT